MLECVAELVGRDTALTQEVEKRTRVDAPRASCHGNALERREPHRRVDRTSVEHRGDRAAAAEVADDEPRDGHLPGYPLDREAVESVAADSPLPPLCRHCIR